jgi:hypothetical protein
MDSLTLATLLVSVVLPLAVGVVTKSSTSSDVKAILLLALAGVTGVVQQIVDNGGLNGFDLKDAAIAAAVSYVLAVLSYYGVLKRDWAGAIAPKVNANVGRKDVSLAA